MLWSRSCVSGPGQLHLLDVQGGWPSPRARRSRWGACGRRLRLQHDDGLVVVLIHAQAVDRHLDHAGLLAGGRRIVTGTGSAAIAAHARTARYPVEVTVPCRAARWERGRDADDGRGRGADRDRHLAARGARRHHRPRSPGPWTRSGIDEGAVLVYCPHTTAAITINENADPDVVVDLLAGLARRQPARRALATCRGELRRAPEVVSRRRERARARERRAPGPGHVAGAVLLRVRRATSAALLRAGTPRSGPESGFLDARVAPCLWLFGLSHGGP